MRDAAKGVQEEIDTEKGKARKDYKRLKKLKSALEAQLALDAQRAALEAELGAAEEREEYDRCDELQAQLDGLAVSATEPQQGAAEEPTPPGVRMDHHRHLSHRPRHAHATPTGASTSVALLRRSHRPCLPTHSSPLFNQGR